MPIGNAVPDWVDMESWNSYINSSEKSLKVYSKLKKFDKFMDKYIFKPDVVDWDRIEEVVVQLGKNVKSEYSPNAVIGIKRGGTIYAKRLAEELDIDPNEPGNIGKMDITHYNSIWGTTYLTQMAPGIFAKADIKKYPEIDVSDKKILIVDDDIASGKTLRSGKEAVMDLGALDVKSGVLYGNNALFFKAGRKLIGCDDADFSGVEKGLAVYPWYQLGGLLYRTD